MFEKWAIENLTEEGANLLKRRFIEIDGEVFQLGDNWRTSAQNSVAGRAYLPTAIPEKQWRAILVIWGDEPIIFDEEPPAPAPEEVEGTEEVEGI